MPKTHVVVSIGKKLTTDDLPPAPANYLIAQSVPQTALLRNATLFVTHNGMNSTNEAMFAGVTMVCLPIFGDQNINATRVEQLGLGVHLRSPFAPAHAQNFDHLTADAIRTAAEQIFANYESYKARSDGMKGELEQQVKYLHTRAVADISDWVDQERKKLKDENC